MTEARFEARIVERIAEPTLAVHLRMPMAEVDMGAIFSRALPALFERAIALGHGIAGAPYGRYFAWGGEAADIEVGVVVDRAVVAVPPIGDVPDGEFGASELPGGPTAVATHRGPYDGLSTTYARLESWIVEQGRTTRPGPWESYVDDPGAVADIADLRTEVSYPLATT
jgi:effector-binding domain-containing protein